MQSTLTPNPGDTPSSAEDDDARTPCGWFLSSQELRQGLEVQERTDEPDRPAAARCTATGESAGA